MAGWILDILFFVFLLGGIAMGAHRGLLKYVTKWAGWIFSFVIGFTCAVSFSNVLESWFGLQTKLAESTGGTLSSILTIVISFFALVLLVRLGALLLGVVGKSMVDKVKIFSIIDKFFGGIVGLALSALSIFFLLAICTWINAEGMNAFINSSYVVGPIYRWDLFIQAAHLKIW